MINLYSADIFKAYHSYTHNIEITVIPYNHRDFTHLKLWVAIYHYFVYIIMLLLCIIAFAYLLRDIGYCLLLIIHTSSQGRGGSN